MKLRIVSEAPKFVACAIIRGGLVFRAAPFLRWAVQRDKDYFIDYCKKKGWQVERVRVSETFEQINVEHKNKKRHQLSP